MDDDPLTELQHEVLEIFFALPQSAGYLLAGGAALIATGLSTRPTDDLDLFGSDLTHGIRDTITFRRLVVRTETTELLVDLAVDSPPLGPPTITTLGPTYAPAELTNRLEPT